MGQYSEYSQRYRAALKARARQVGEEHARAGMPAWVTADHGSALLMGALGLTEPTAEHNHAERIAYCNAYSEGYEANSDGPDGPDGSTQEPCGDCGAPAGQPCAVSCIADQGTAR